MEETRREQKSELASLIEHNISADGIHPTVINRLSLIRASQPSPPMHALHEPALCIVVQGRKQVIL